MGLFNRELTAQETEVLVNKTLDRFQEMAVASINRTNGLVPQKPQQISMTSNIMAKVTRYLGRYLSSNRVSFAHNSGYDMQRMISAMETEGFFARVIDQFRMSVLQRGFDFVGANPSYVEYVRKRFFEIEIVSEQTLREIFAIAIGHTIAQGNAFFTLIRNETSSSGKPWTRFDGKEFMPIAAIEIQDTTAMRINFDYKKNMINSYYQLKGNRAGDDGRALVGFNFGYNSFGRGQKRNNDYIVEWKSDDVKHMRWMPMAGKVWAMPPFTPIIDDILALREIEESVQLLIYQYGHPILHGRVTDINPDNKQQTINTVTMNLSKMEGNGAIITGDEVEFKMIGAESVAVQVEGYLAYFQQRVLSGLYTSGISMGQGNSANRNSADFIDRRQQEVTKELQNLLIETMQPICDQLILEAGKSMEDLFKNRVSLWFPDPDVTAKIQNEQHYMLLYQANCITEDEMRKAIGRQALSEVDRDKLYQSLVTAQTSEHENELMMEAAEQQNQLAMQLAAKQAKLAPKTVTKPASKTNSKGNSKTNKGQGAKKSAKQTVTPSNQHGTKTKPGSTKN